MKAQGYAQFNITMSSSQPTLTPAERIRELSAINADVPALLSSAANAVNALTDRPINAASTDSDDMVDVESDNSPAAHKEAFTKNTTAYFTHIQSIMARLRRQAYALEEAGIIAAEAPTLSSTGAAPETAGLARRGPQGQPQRQPAEDGDRVTNGGLGGLDVGLLNSRGNSVGLDKEAELIAEAKQMVADIFVKRLGKFFSTSTYNTTKMATYDSDSDFEDENFTETNVLLGYATKDVADDTTSQLGGHPTWLDEKTTPPGDLAKCKNCNNLLTLLLQLNGDLPDRFPGHERRLYLWACKKKACRRKDGSVRAFRAIRASAIPAESEKPKQQKKEETPQEAAAPAAPKTNIGESLFGVKPPTSGSSPLNPFATGGASSRPANPFSTAPASSPAAPSPAAPTPAATQPTPSLSETFASKARISSPEPNTTPAIPTGPREPWPQQSSFPPPYPSYYLDADYETLDAEKPEIPQQTRVDMDLDAGEGGSSGQDMDVKDAFESSMDKAFQRFADRMSQNPEQILRYEFAGQPLLYSKTDAVGRLLGAHQDGNNNAKVKTSGKTGMPRCNNCGAERLFELQLTPYAIVELEAEELGLEGMEWGTVILGVCEKDCVMRGQKEGEVGYVEEWVGVQWEELTGKK
ncbi:hypothetical protein D6C82_04721 [Aureobasidium pullulans]|nr:hypothetical protein D6C82_04721 [Aureobasidium pullulans]